MERLRRACIEGGFWLSHDDCVREDAAAYLLGKEVKTLANWRYAGAPLPYQTRASRILYRLSDLAARMN